MMMRFAWAVTTQMAQSGTGRAARSSRPSRRTRASCGDCRNRTSSLPQASRSRQRRLSPSGDLRRAAAWERGCSSASGEPQTVYPSWCPVRFIDDVQARCPSSALAHGLPRRADAEGDSGRTADVPAWRIGRPVSLNGCRAGRGCRIRAAPGFPAGDIPCAWAFRSFSSSSSSSS